VVAQFLHDRVVVCRGVVDGQVHHVLRVAVVVLPLCRQREVREREVDREHPRPVVAVCPLVEPLGRGVDVLGVAALVAAGLVGGTGGEDALASVLADVRRVALQPVHVGRSPVVRPELLVEHLDPGLEVEFPDAGRVDAPRRAVFGPVRAGAVVGGSVVPRADLVDVPAGGEAPPAGGTQRAGTVGVRKARAVGRQPVESGRLDQVVAGVAGRVRAVLVGEDQEDVACVVGIGV
jgi:hypothetical protein